MIYHEMRSYQGRGYHGFGSTDQEVSSWCQGAFPNDPLMAAKCSGNSFPASLSPPWTAAGALLRGIPKGGSTAAGAPLTTAGGSGGIFSIPSTILIAGGAVLAIGLVAMRARKKAPAPVSGYRRRRRRR